jgi:hypothetical protein
VPTTPFKAGDKAWDIYSISPKLIEIVSVNIHRKRYRVRPAVLTGLKIRDRSVSVPFRFVVSNEEMTAMKLLNLKGPPRAD